MLFSTALAKPNEVRRKPLGHEGSDSGWRGLPQAGHRSPPRQRSDAARIQFPRAGIRRGLSPFRARSASDLSKTFSLRD